MPYVVYEATYAPQANPDYPRFTPGYVHLRFGTPAAREFALVDHLKPQQVVACRSLAAPDTCLPGELIADVLPFDPERAALAAAPSIVGCAAIDSASEQDRLARTRSEGSANQRTLHILARVLPRSRPMPRTARVKSQSAWPKTRVWSAWV